MSNFWPVLFLLLVGAARAQKGKGSATVATVHCEAGYTQLGTSDQCVIGITAQVAFAAAHADCLSRGAELVSIHDREENTFLFDMITTQHLRPYPWIGLQRSETTSGFEWTDGSDVTFVKWDHGSGQPDANDCAWLSGDNENWSTQYGCLEPGTYICAKAGIPITTTTEATTTTTEATTTTTEATTTTTEATTTTSSSAGTDCATGWVPHGNARCVLAVNQRQTWQVAHSDCLSKQAELVSIHSQEDNDFFKNLAAVNFPQQNYPWIGFHRDSDLIFHWSDDTDADFTNWALGQPVPGADNNCAWMSEAQAGKWKSGSGCGSPGPYFCERVAGTPTTTEPSTTTGSTSTASSTTMTAEATTTTPARTSTSSSAPTTTQAQTTSTTHSNRCASGWTLLSGTDKCVKAFVNRTTWTVAHQACVYMGAELMSIHSDEENMAFSEFSVAAIGRLAVPWIGLRYSDSETQGFQWTDNTTKDFTNWAVGQPVLPACGYMNVQTSRWYTDGGCLSPGEFVCSKPAAALTTMTEASTTTPTTTSSVRTTTLAETSTTAVANPCASGWTLLSGTNKCVKAFVNRTTWTVAHRGCLNMGAELMSIHSDEENMAFSEFSVAAIGRRAVPWIGLRYSDSETQGFQWTDNTTKDYTNWADGQPVLPACGYMFVQSSSWYSGGGCGSPGEFVCSKPAAAVTTTTEASTTTPTTTPVSTTSTVRTTTLAETSTTAVANPCASGWTLLSGTSKCVKAFVNRTTWTVAHQGCVSIGAELMSIHSDEENMAFSEFSVATIGRHAVPWIGLRFSDTHGYQWTDNTSTEFTNWHAGQPSVQGCAYMYVTQSFWWTSGGCDAPGQFVCSKPVQQCDFGWVAGMNGKCVLAVNDLATWQAARDHCITQGAELVSIHSQQENDFFRNLTLSLLAFPYPWIGLRRSETGNDFQWSDSSAVDFVNWSAGQPQPGRNCAWMNNRGKWLTVSGCIAPGPYFCQRAVGATTPAVTTPTTTQASTTTPTTTTAAPECSGAGWVQYGDQEECVKAFSQQATFDAARSTCLSHAADLVSIHTDSDNQFVADIGSTLPNKYPWIGFRRSGTGNFAWTDGSDSDFENWSTGQPTNDCAYMSTSPGIGNFGMWHTNGGCGLPGPFICQRSIQTTEPPPTTTVTGSTPSAPTTSTSLAPSTTTTAAPPPCDDGWIVNAFDPSTCLRPITTALPMPVAELFCVVFGGHLMSIHSRGENTFLLLVAFTSLGPNQSPWLGLKRAETGAYSWSDDSDMTYTNWAGGHPGDSSEPCAYMQATGTPAGRWKTTTCFEPRLSLCEKDANGNKDQF